MNTDILASIPDNMPATGAVYLLNFPAAHTAGLRYVTRQIDAAEARNVIASARVVISAVGHAGAAAALSADLGRAVPASRLEVTFRPGDTIICAQLRRRLAEGQILDAAEMQSTCYDLVRIDVAAAPVVVIFGSAAAAVVGRPGWSRGHSDIDVIYAGCDGAEAIDLAHKFLLGRGPHPEGVEFDLHPELARRGEDGGIVVTIPHPAGCEAPPVSLVTGAAEIRPEAFDTLPAVIRRAAALVSARIATAADAGKMIGEWMSTHGADILLAPTREGIEVGAYVGNTLAAIRRAAAKLELAISGYDDAGDRRLSAAVVAEINRANDGAGALLRQLVVGINPGILAPLRRGAPAGAGHTAAQHGMLRIARDADGSWSAGPVHGNLAMTLAQAAEWLGAYGQPTPLI